MFWQQLLQANPHEQTQIVLAVWAIVRAVSNRRIGILLSTERAEIVGVRLHVFADPLQRRDGVALLGLQVPDQPVAARPRPVARSSPAGRRRLPGYLRKVRADRNHLLWLVSDGIGKRS